MRPVEIAGPEQPILELARTAIELDVTLLSKASPNIQAALRPSLWQDNDVQQIAIDGDHYVVCRIGQPGSDRLLAGPFRYVGEEPAGRPILDAAAAQRATSVVERATVALREVQVAERQRLELANHLEVVGRSVLAVTGELELDRVLRRIVDLARELAGARYGALGVPGPDGMLAAFLTSGVSEEEQERIGPLPRGRGVLGLLLREPVTIRLPDISAHPASVGFPPNHPPMKSFLGVPIISRGRVVGDLYLTEKQAAREFSDSDARLVEILARHAAVAIENASLYRSIAQQQQHLQVVIDQLPEAVILAEADPERITLSNQRASHVLGWDIRPPVDISAYLDRNRRFDPEGAQLAGEQLPIVRSLREGAEIARAEIGVERPDGTVVTLLVNSAPLRDDRERITGALVVFQDISQIKDAEQLKDDFLSLVSHELRTPLTTIQAGATMLVRDWERIDPESQREVLDDIARQGARLGVIIENMVQLAHIRAGRRRMELEPVRIETIIHSAIEAVRQFTADREVGLDVAPRLVAEVDADRIEQVVVNLLHNAFKYSPPTSPVEVRAFQEDAEVLISVRDHGPGINSEDLPYIFDRFRRAASAEASAAPGMGLGLFLSRHVVQAHAGRIWVEQPADGGTRVCFAVPAIDTQ